MPTDNLKPTGRPGVFYIEHSEKNYKSTKRKMRQYILRYTIDGKTYKGVFGWEDPENGVTLPDAEKKIAEFKENARRGEGPITIREEREQRRRREEEKKLQETLRAMENVTLDEYFFGPYLDAANSDKKPRTVGSEKALYEKWIQPVMGHKPIKDLLRWDFDRLKKKVLAGEKKKDPSGKTYHVPKSPRTVHYCASIVTQVWNMAFDNGHVKIRPPRRKALNLPLIDNERTRAFSLEQAQRYFEEMALRSPKWHDISKLALFTGLRASEIFRLEIKDFDEDRGQVFLKTPKMQKSQNLILNETAVGFLKELREKQKEEVKRLREKGIEPEKNLFFLDSKGRQIKEVSDTVQRVIDGLGFNDGVTDKRDRLSFHSWRHTYATQLLEKGTDIYTVSKLCRHSSLKQTQRYVHPEEERLRKAAKELDGLLDQPQEKAPAQAEEK